MNNTSSSALSSATGKRIKTVEVIETREILHRETQDGGPRIDRVEYVLVTFTDGTTFVNEVQFWYDGAGRLLFVRDLPAKNYDLPATR